MYLVLSLYAIGVGAIGLGMFYILTRRDNKFALKSVLAGIILIIIGFVVNENRPVVEGAATITVKAVSLSETTTEPNQYHCDVVDEASGISYRFVGADSGEAAAYCEKFKVGSDYKIEYKYEEEQYYFHNHTDGQ
ncbi:hypothetical protein LC085_03795 [Bacillus tianshenii]|uniref:hypothetical protein n=1 Tax=Sutcliffiella tianshenii TaxID=1463404 RepID=UPI001CD5EA3B|nr:hypothetical protein [Bacillus tianshenii]MCA1319024.1 hypothetical protein [Bacillus tianshenii]